MLTHADIIRTAGGAQVVHDALGFTDKLHTVRSWIHRDSIPAEFWAALAEKEFATLEQLAAAVAAKRGVSVGGVEGDHETTLAVVKPPVIRKAVEVFR